MLLRITNLRTPVELPEHELPGEVANRLDVPLADLQGLKILRKSMDARNRFRLEYVYSLSLTIADADIDRFRHGYGIDVAEWEAP